MIVSRRLLWFLFTAIMLAVLGPLVAQDQPAGEAPAKTVAAPAPATADTPAPSPMPAAPAPATGATTPPKAEIVRLPNGDIRIGLVTLHRKERQLSFPATVNLLNGVLEVLIATPEGRLHESLLKTGARPLHLQTLLYLLGCENGRRLAGPDQKQGDLIDLDIEWRKADGQTVREPIENWVLDARQGKPMQRIGWVFVGATFHDGVAGAESEGNLALTYSMGDTILDIPDVSGDDDTVYVCNPEHKEPAAGTEVRVLITPQKAQKDKNLIP